MTVIEVKFRKGGRDCPPLGAALADDGAARFGRNADRASFISQFPHNPHADGFHAAESLGESFVTDAHRFRDEDERGVDKPLPIIGALLCGFALWSAGAFAWWIA